MTQQVEWNKGRKSKPVYSRILYRPLLQTPTQVSSIRFASCRDSIAAIHLPSQSSSLRCSSRLRTTCRDNRVAPCMLSTGKEGGAGGMLSIVEDSTIGARVVLISGLGFRPRRDRFGGGCCEAPLMSLAPVSLMGISKISCDASSLSSDLRFFRVCRCDGELVPGFPSVLGGFNLSRTVSLSIHGGIWSSAPVSTEVPLSSLMTRRCVQRTFALLQLGHTGVSLSPSLFLPAVRGRRCFY